VDPGLARRIARTSYLGNFLGGILTFAYFRFVDHAAHGAEVPVSALELAYFAAGFALLIAVGDLFVTRWSRGLTRRDAPATEAERLELKRRALLYPYVIAGIALAGWALAGVIWGVVWPWLGGRLTLPGSIHAMFGISCIAGTATTAFVFFATEHQWRAALPTLFPDGEFAAVPGVFRLPVRVRLLVMFLVVSVIPMSMLGVVAGTRAASLVGADPLTARTLVEALVVVIVFLVAVGAATAVGLAIFVSHSVAGPVAQLRTAMGAVERGVLDVRAPVVSNDELGALAEGFNHMVHGLRDRERLRETFGRYVSPEVRDEILAGRISLDGQLREVTILFSDLRDFTPWVERTDARDVVRALNGYFTEMEGAIRQHRGLVLQFIGDEIEAVFGAPVPDAAHADRAVQAALEMRRRLATFNAGRARAGLPPLRHGIGIHTGTVLAASIGSADRLSYALVGDPVNVASRIQDLTKEAATDVLVSGAARARLAAAYPLSALAAMRVKGKSAEVEVYRLE
jgi:class 3 adenylate cyclase